MADSNAENAEYPIEGEFEGEADLERLIFLFTTEDRTPIATVEGSKSPAPEVGEVVSFGVGERVMNFPEMDFQDTTITSGQEYKIEDREFCFVNQTLEYQDMKIGPLTRGRTGRGLTTIVFYTVSEVE